MPEIKVADEVWVGTALLHREQPDRESFSIVEIVDRVAKEGLHRPLRPGVQVHASLHCVANKRPNPGTYRMLYETRRGRRRLFRRGDDAHEYRAGKIVPDHEDLPHEYRYLLDWYAKEYDIPETEKHPWRDAKSRTSAVQGEQATRESEMEETTDSEGVGAMTNEQRVLMYLRSIAPRGATNTQIREQLGITPHQQVFQKTRSLVEQGLVRGEQDDSNEWIFYASDSGASTS